MFADYVAAAMLRAGYKVFPQEQTFYGSIPGFRGVFANAANLAACRKQLKEILEGWLLLRISKGLPIPAIDGTDLR